MGPLASAQFMVRLTQLTPATRDQDHIPTVLWSDPRVPDRTVAQPSGEADPLPWLLRGVESLQRAGCGAIAIPCNTAHRWYDAMCDAARVPILHIVDAAATELRRVGITSGRCGVMATEAALSLRLYQDRLGAQGWDCIVPSQDEMDRLVSPAIALVKLNRMVDAYAPLADGGAEPCGPRRRVGRPGLHRDTAGYAVRPFARPADSGHDRRLGTSGNRVGEIVAGTHGPRDVIPR